jgi:hypothetical protein
VWKSFQLVNTSTGQHINTSTGQYINTSASYRNNISTQSIIDTIYTPTQCHLPIFTCTSTHQHINTSAHRAHLLIFTFTSTHLHICTYTSTHQHNVIYTSTHLHINTMSSTHQHNINTSTQSCHQHNVINSSTPQHNVINAVINPIIDTSTINTSNTPNTPTPQHINASHLHTHNHLHIKASTFIQTVSEGNSIRRFLAVNNLWKWLPSADDIKFKLPELLWFQYFFILWNFLIFASVHFAQQRAWGWDIGHSYRYDLGLFRV